MVNAKKIYKRTVTVERLFIRGSTTDPAVLFCTGCGRMTEMLSFDHASVSAGISMRKLFHLSENGVIHSTETNTGRILFCRESIDVFLKSIFSTESSNEEIDDDCA